MDEVVFGRYRLLSVLGEGGMGKVYRAHDTMMDRDVAVKVLPSELANDPAYKERFRREARVAARLIEPHIIPIYETGEIEGQLYLSMPIIEGIDLHGLLKRDGPMSAQRAVHVIEQLAAALEAAHAVGLVHRDVKPSNALVTGRDFVYLIDFGIAHDAAGTKLTSTGMIVGTLSYMAPERFTSGVADARTDVYALACVLYECLTGAPPYPGDSMEAQIAGHLTSEPPTPSTHRTEVPVGFDEVIATGLAKDPAQRYQSAQELASAAQRALASASASTAVSAAAATRLASPAPVLADGQASASTLSARTTQVIERDKLGPRSKIAQGGQGVVYRAPNVKTKFAASMVYKEYKPPVLAQMDLTALSAMPALLEQSLSYPEAERLVSIAAWPCALVEDTGRTTGFVMPAIPDAFFVSLRGVRGPSPTAAEFQHLLHPPSVLQARGITLDDVQRYTLLREVASALAFLHRHGVCVGDISPKNLLFSLNPREAVYFIDCDAMRINGVSALPQVETPGWATPVGEELATVYSDAYKLGLLALRLLAGTQDTTNTAHVPATTPGLLRQAITDTLTNPPTKRPLAEAWTYVLGDAIDRAQHEKLISQQTQTPIPPAHTPPPIPNAWSRPPSQSRPPSAPPVRSSAPPVPIPYSQPTGPTWYPPSTPTGQPQTATSTAPMWIGVGLAGIVLVAVVVLVVGLTNKDNSTSPAIATGTTTATGPSGYSTDSYTRTTPPSTEDTPTASVPPPLVQTPDSYGKTCGNGFSLPDKSGWATRSGRGSEQTSCQFAENVLIDYWQSYRSPSRQSRTVSVAGTVPCPSVRANSPTPVACSGDNFVMTCVVVGSDTWITCTGGNKAMVYLY